MPTGQAAGNWFLQQRRLPSSMHRRFYFSSMWLPWSRIARLDDTISFDYATEHFFRPYLILPRGEEGASEMSETISRLYSQGRFKYLSRFLAESLGVGMMLCKHGKTYPITFIRYFLTICANVNRHSLVNILSSIGNYRPMRAHVVSHANQLFYNNEYEQV